MEAVQAEAAGLEEEKCQHHRVVAAAAVVGFRLARHLEAMEAAAVARPMMVAVAEEQPGRWLEAREVAEARLLLGQAVGVVPRQLAAAVLGERWKLVVGEVLPGFSQVNPGSVGKLEEGEAARPIQGPSEAGVAAGLAGLRLFPATEVGEVRGHDFVVGEEHSSVPGMPGARRTGDLVLWCLRQGTLPVAVEGEDPEP